MTKAEALEVITQVEELARAFGQPNEQAKRALLGLVHRLLTDGPENDYYREKLADIRDLAGTGLSRRKFSKHPGGASQVRVWLLGSASVVRGFIEEHWPR